MQVILVVLGHLPLRSGLMVAWESWLLKRLEELPSSRCFVGETGILGQVFKWKGPFGMWDAIYSMRPRRPWI